MLLETVYILLAYNGVAYGQEIAWQTNQPRKEGSGAYQREVIRSLQHQRHISASNRIWRKSSQLARICFTVPEIESLPFLFVGGNITGRRNSRYGYIIGIMANGYTYADKNYQLHGKKRPGEFQRLIVSHDE